MKIKETKQMYSCFAMINASAKHKHVYINKPNLPKKKKTPKKHTKIPNHVYAFPRKRLTEKFSITLVVPGSTS